MEIVNGMERCAVPRLILLERWPPSRKLRTLAPARSGYWPVSEMALKHQSFVPVSVHIGCPHNSPCSRNRVT